MKCLFIDSATSYLVVALIIDEKIVYQFNEKVDKDMSSTIMVKINEAFQKANIKPKDIDKIFAVNGPGSFTGIRVGLTVCKTMAWSLNIPVVPISSLEVIASGTPGDKNCSLIDARREYVYAGVYDSNLNNIMEDKHILFKKLDPNLTFISYDEIGNIKPNIDILKVINKHKNEEGINPHLLNPKYLKLTEAEEKLNDKANR